MKRGEPVRPAFKTAAGAPLTGRSRQQRRFPVHVIKAWQAALFLADGDPRRLRTQPDGSVVVSNNGGG
jgi:hypothetical protein